jgi:YhcH/YjgK/YiaL family protein
MVIDKIENRGLYTSLGSGIEKALNYIANTDFSILKPGRYELDGDDIYAIVSDYVTKDRTECRLEAHRKYVDVQYVAAGSETAGYAPLGSQTPLTGYDDSKDCVFYGGGASFIQLAEGIFAIFFPDDLHMPGTGASPSPVRKVVVKVKI